MFGGVCGGIAAYLNVDAILVRFAFIMLIFASGIGLPLYLILMFLMPAEDNDSDSPPVRHPDWYLEEEIKITEEDVENVKEQTRAAQPSGHPQGPIIFSIVLISIGFYLLAQNIGFLGWLNIGWFGPLLIIGIGLFVIYRRRNN
jgi:phage shock protein PspC (stress-responsive transcriptional regulator)